MEHTESQPEAPEVRLLVVERSRLFREGLLSLLAQEGYAARGVASLEEALAALDEQSYACILADLFAGVSRHSFTPAHILRRRAQLIPLGLITPLAHVLEDPQLEGFAFAHSRPIDVTTLFTQIAACLKYPLDMQQQRQTQILERFLAVWNAQEWKSLLRLCTEEISYYPSSLSPRAAHSPIQGKLAFLGLVTALRRSYHRVRVEVQGVYRRPQGLAVCYSGCAARYGENWEFFSGVELVRFTDDRICQIGTPLSNLHWRGRMELPDNNVGLGRSS